MKLPCFTNPYFFLEINTYVHYIHAPTQDVITPTQDDVISPDRRTSQKAHRWAEKNKSEGVQMYIQRVHMDFGPTSDPTKIIRPAHFVRNNLIAVKINSIRSDIDKDVSR